MTGGIPAADVDDVPLVRALLNEQWRRALRTSLATGCRPGKRWLSGTPVASAGFWTHHLMFVPHELVDTATSIGDTADSAHWGASCPRQGSSLPPTWFDR
jgi:hypothetical protein